MDIQYNRVTGQFEDELGNIYSAQAASNAANRGDSSTIIGSSTAFAPRPATNSSTTTGQSSANSTFAPGYSPVPIAGIYGVGGPGYGAKVNDPDFRMQGVKDGQAAFTNLSNASVAIDTPSEYRAALEAAYNADAGVDTAYQKRSTAWEAEAAAKDKLYNAEQNGTPAEIASARSVLVSAQDDVGTTSQALSDAQTLRTSSYGVVEANVPKGFARDYATQTNQDALPYTRTILDNVTDAALGGIGSLAGGLYRGAHAVGSNLPVVGGYVGDAIEGAGEWFQTSPGVIAGSPTSVQGQWGGIPPWMPTSQVNVLGQIPGSATNVGTMTGTILDTLNAVRNGQITLSEAIEEGGLTELATVLGVSDLALQAAALAGKTLQDIATDKDAAAVALAADENEGGTTLGGVTLNGNLATQIIEGNTTEKAAEKLLTDQQAALAKATEVFDGAGGGAAGTAAVLQALEDNGLTVQDLADQTGIPLTELNTFIGANTAVVTDTDIDDGWNDSVNNGELIPGGTTTTTDEILATAGSDEILGFAGTDEILGTAGTDEILATEGTDEILATEGTAGTAGYWEEFPGDPSYRPITPVLPGGWDRLGYEDIQVGGGPAYEDPYSILPAPPSDPRLADRRPQDIRNVGAAVGLRSDIPADQQSPRAVQRMARYVNQFGVGTSELADIFGTSVDDLSAAGDYYGVDFDVTGPTGGYRSLGNSVTGGVIGGGVGAVAPAGYGYDTTGGTTNNESWRDLILDTEAQSISADVRNILNTAKDSNEISNQITRLLDGVDSPYIGIPSVAVDGVVRRAAGVPEGQDLRGFFNGFETRPTLRRFYTEAGIVPSFASTVDRRGGYSEQDIANAAFYLNSGYLTADQVAQHYRQNQQGVEGLDVTGEDVSQNLVDYNARTDLNLLGQNVVPAEQYDFSAFGIPGVTTTTYTDELTNEQVEDPFAPVANNGDYLPADVQYLKSLVDNDTVDAQTVADQYGLGLDETNQYLGLAQYNVDNEYDPLEINTVYNSLNNGDLDMEVASNYFQQSPEYIQSAMDVIGAERDAYVLPEMQTSGIYSPEDTQDVASRIASGQLNIADMAAQYDVTEDYITQNMASMGLAVPESLAFNEGGEVDAMEYWSGGPLMYQQVEPTPPPQPSQNRQEAVMRRIQRRAQSV